MSTLTIALVGNVHMTRALDQIESHWLDEDRGLYVVLTKGGRRLTYNWSNVLYVEVQS